VAIEKISECGVEREAVRVDAKDGHKIGHSPLNVRSPT
jgi:hypothetical protein